jgi:hypothetical protein
MWSRRSLPLAGLVLLLACGPEPVAVSARVTIMVLDGDGQSAIREQPLKYPLQVRVEREGVPVAGMGVMWAPSAGTVLVASDTTDASGKVSVRWYLGAVPGPMSVTATVVGADASPAVFRATALPLVTVTADSSTDRQSVVAGTPLPLRVTVRSEGVPAPGAMVQWHASGGTVPPSTVADGAGVASASWILPTLPGRWTARAVVDGAAEPVAFSATTIAGPPAQVLKIAGDGETIGPYTKKCAHLMAWVTDQYGNAVGEQDLIWSIESGPATFYDGSDRWYGQRDAFVCWAVGAPGTALVRAAPPDEPVSGLFTLQVVAPPDTSLPLVVLNPFLPGFVSFDGTQPALDTIPAGATMTWMLHPFDYDQHDVTSVGSPSFTGGAFPYQSPSVVTVKFTEPGTYLYRDSYTGATGTVVVR